VTIVNPLLRSRFLSVVRLLVVSAHVTHIDSPPSVRVSNKKGEEPHVKGVPGTFFFGFSLFGSFRIQYSQV